MILFDLTRKGVRGFRPEQRILYSKDSMDNMTIFDLMSVEEKEKHVPKKSTDWKWIFSDYPKEKNGLKVFSCFACGGGSTMGYKLAGCDVLGCCEIDAKMNEVYVKNHQPKYNFLMDIREFNKLIDIPEELYSLDILDGSPPCTTFSMAGEREETWGKKKKFREGQEEQTLDDLSFVFIETVAKLKPKCVVMENVEGLIKGEAWGYVQKIYEKLHLAGYQVKHWLLKGEEMGVPQTRHRVFFIALRNDIKIDLGEIDMSFNYEPVLYKEFKSTEGDKYTNPEGKLYKLLLQAQKSDKSICDIILRNGGRPTAFQERLVRDNDIFPTIRASRACDYHRVDEMTKVTARDVISAQTFPQDYDFGTTGKTLITYICGMSVPPIMIKRIVARLIEAGIFRQMIPNNS